MTVQPSRTRNLRAAMIGLAVFVLVAVAGLAWQVRQSGNAVIAASDQLTRQYAPELVLVARLRADAIQVERGLYEYYATADPSTYTLKVKPREQSALETAGRLPDVMEVHDLVQKLGAEGDALNTTMTRHPIDWDEARTILERVSAIGDAIIVKLNANVTRVENAVANAGHRTDETVHASTRLGWFLTSSIALAGLGIFLALRAFLRESADRREVQKKLAHAALHDDLTGLPNRRQLMSDLNHLIRTGSRVGLLTLHLMRYRTLVAGLDQELADTLLAAAAKRLSDPELTKQMSSVRLYRLEGEYFALLFNAENHRPDCARDLVTGFSAPIVAGGQSLVMELRGGFAYAPEDAVDAESLLSAADLAMHAAQFSTDNLVSYTAELGQKRQDSLVLEQALHGALNSGQLEPFFQPQVNAQGQLVGAETLIRWRHPDKGLISPAAFIPLAEESGLIIPIGREILAAACRQGVAWLAEGNPPLLIAVNVSVHQCTQAGFVEEVAAVLSETGYPAQWLELEITESIAAGDAEAMVTWLGAMKGLGVKLAMDDFGTGFSSLSYLRRFPIDKLKIDQSFVRGLPDDAQSAAITRTIIALGRELGLTVIAEGVETRIQADWLLASGCHELQGYLLARPMPAGDFSKWRLQASGSVTEQANLDKSPLPQMAE